MPMIICFTDLKSELAVSSVHKHASFEDTNSIQGKDPTKLGEGNTVETVDGMTNTTPQRLNDIERQKMNTLLSAGVTPSGKGPTGMPVGTPLTPSARISALNIVSDLLRKVGVSIK